MATFIWLGGLFPRKFKVSGKLLSQEMRGFDTLGGSGTPWQAIIAKGNVIEGVVAEE